MDTSSIVEINDVIPEVLGKFDQINKDKDAFRGMRTGFTKLDYLTNGPHPTDLVLIAARPATGKTSFAMNIVENVATKLREKSAWYSHWKWARISWCRECSVRSPKSACKRR